MKKIFGIKRKKTQGRAREWRDDQDFEEYDDDYFEDEEEIDEYDDEVDGDYDEVDGDYDEEIDEYDEADSDYEEIDEYDEVDGDYEEIDEYDEVDSDYDEEIDEYDEVDSSYEEDTDICSKNENCSAEEFDRESMDADYDDIDYYRETADESSDDIDYDRESMDADYDDIEYDRESSSEEYDMDYDEESEEYDDEQSDTLGKRIVTFVMKTTAAERIAVVFAILIIAGGILTASFYASAMNNNKQLDSFAEVGSTMEEIEVVGQSGLIAVADAEKARAMAAQLVSEDAVSEDADEEEEEEEIVVADDAEDVTIYMTVTSIKSDIKVKFINSKTNKLVASVPFEIDVVNPDGTSVTYNDHDQDGIIYKKDMTAGEYKITPKTLPSEYDKYNLEIKTKSLTVKDTVEMKAVDVSNEIKKESQVNVAAEDTAVKTVVESTLTDTVEWVESSKTAVGDNSDGEYTYEEIDRSNITDPTSSSALLMGSYIKYAFGNMFLENLSSSDASSLASTVKEDTESGASSGSGSTEKNDSTSGESSQSATDSSTVEKSDGSASSSGSTGTEENNEKKNETVEKKNITVNSSAINIKVNETASVSVSGPSSASFSSNNESVATVSGSGTMATITGKSAGTATITIVADGYNDVTVSVTVSEVVKGTIEVSASSTSIKVGATSTISVKGPEKYTFSSNNEKVAKVDANGVVTGVEKGEAKITVSAEGYNSADVTLTVTDNSETKVPMSISRITLVEGQKIDVTSSDSSLAVTLSCSNDNVASVSGNTITAKASGEATITVSSSGYADNTVVLTVTSNTTTLKDKDGNVVYVLNSDGTYREATYEDYYNGNKLYLRRAATEYKYTGWQTIGGKTYFYDKNGNYVTGEQIIQGAKYTFGSDGALSTGSGTRGIDVSKWNGNIDWAAVKNSGVQFVIIRCGYRGSSQGALIEDPTFKKNIKGAINAGLNVGVYFFTQAVNEVEAVEEASMVINLIKGYNITYPVYLDVEASNGRGDKISASQRTANIKAFCGTIQNAGYKAGVYANRTWFTSHINTSSLTNYRIWLAQYAASVTYNATRYDMWQYTSKGKVTGISGNVDMNICY